MIARPFLVAASAFVCAACSSSPGTGSTGGDGGASSNGGTSSGAASGGGGSSSGNAGSGSTSSGGTSTSSGGSSGGSSSGATSSGGPVGDGGSCSACPPSWTVTPTCGASSNTTLPNFGPNVLIFDPATPAATIQTQIDGIYNQQQNSQFGTGRYAYLFKPGAYNLDVQIGFYMQVIGLGQTPDAVSITGAVRSKANGDATQKFWRGVDNLGVIPTPAFDNSIMVWAVSQGTHLRRVHVHGGLHLSDGGNSSGGFIADSLVDGIVVPGSQQQWFTRNSDLQGWTGANWNIVFMGEGPGTVIQPAGTWPAPPISLLPTTPIIREKPFLYVDSSGNYFVMVPAIQTNTIGHSWGNTTPPGYPLSIGLFYIATPADTAATINAALASGKHLLLTPGVYHLDSPIQVNNPGTVVMGLGLPSLLPTGSNPALTVADVDGVTLSGFLLDAGPTSAPTLLQVGSAGSTQDHTCWPTAIFDIHCRVGGAEPGTALSCVTINSNDVLTDNTWYWRADHGSGVGWTSNKSNSGLIVNGNDVTAYGLFVEHHQQYQTLWNGNGGATYFYQSELPYDPPNQAAWEESPTQPGYPSYKVADTVTTHTAEGLGVYAVFDSGSVSEFNAFETPTAPGVALHHMVTVSIRGTITHIINGTGPTAQAGSTYGYSTN